MNVAGNFFTPFNKQTWTKFQLYGDKIWTKYRFNLNVMVIGM